MKYGLLAVSLVFGNLLTGCSTFALSYQNYFTKNFAYVASGYSGNPNTRLSDGAESNDIDDGNRSSYSVADYPTVAFGFRSLEHHNSQYTSGNSMNETIVATFIPPNKTEAEAVTFLTLEMSGKNMDTKPGTTPFKNLVFIKQSYPALFVNFDNKALQAAHGSGTYTIIWKSLKAGGKPENRELSRVVTNLVP